MTDDPDAQPDGPPDAVSRWRPDAPSDRSSLEREDVLRAVGRTLYRVFRILLVVHVVGLGLWIAVSGVRDGRVGIAGFGAAIALAAIAMYAATGEGRLAERVRR